jgi:hypothetical protein
LVHNKTLDYKNNMILIFVMKKISLKNMVLNNR